MRAAILALLLTASPAFATSYAQPKRHDVFSRNGAFVLDVNPETEVHAVYDVRDRTKPLWSFSKPVWHYPFLVSDDGAVVVTVAWEHIQAERIDASVGVRFWNKDGEFRSYSLADLCADPPKTQDVGIGPIGDFWRTWYTDVEDHGDGFTLRTTCGVAHRFRYADGELVEGRRIGFVGRGAWWWVGCITAAIVVGVALWRYRRRICGKPLPARSADAEPSAAVK